MNVTILVKNENNFIPVSYKDLEIKNLIGLNVIGILDIRDFKPEDMDCLNNLYSIIKSRTGFDYSFFGKIKEST